MEGERKGIGGFEKAPKGVFIIRKKGIETKGKHSYGREGRELDHRLWKEKEVKGVDS